METLILTYDDGEQVTFPVASGYVARCVSAIAEDNHPDARWAAKVLNRYGHLIPHEADRFAAQSVRAVG